MDVMNFIMEGLTEQKHLPEEKKFMCVLDLCVCVRARVCVCVCVCVLQQTVTVSVSQPNMHHNAINGSCRFHTLPAFILTNHRCQEQPCENVEMPMHY